MEAPEVKAIAIVFQTTWAETEWSTETFVCLLSNKQRYTPMPLKIRVDPIHRNIRSVPRSGKNEASRRALRVGNGIA
jgi:hypothetical protein